MNYIFPSNVKQQPTNREQAVGADKYVFMFSLKLLLDQHFYCGCIYIVLLYCYNTTPVPTFKKKERRKEITVLRTIDRYIDINKI